MQGISRRTFLAGATVGATALAGIAARDPRSSEESIPQDVYTCFDDVQDPPSYGPFIPVGGWSEDPDARKNLLEKLSPNLNLQSGKVVVCTAASDLPLEEFELYEGLFKGVGAGKVEFLEVRKPEDSSPEKLNKVFSEDLRLFALTGGDQFRITERIPPNSPFYKKIVQTHERGVVIMGWSAGASVMSWEMPWSKNQKDRRKYKLVPGFGFIRAIIDQHFKRPGSRERLLDAVAQTKLSGLALEEDTAFVKRGKLLKVVGSGYLTIINFNREPLTLSNGESYNLETRERLAA